MGDIGNLTSLRTFLKPGQPKVTMDPPNVITFPQKVIHFPKKVTNFPQKVTIHPQEQSKNRVRKENTHPRPIDIFVDEMCCHVAETGEEASVDCLLEETRKRWRVKCKLRS